MSGKNFSIHFFTLSLLVNLKNKYRIWKIALLLTHLPLPHIFMRFTLYKSQGWTFGKSDLKETGAFLPHWGSNLRQYMLNLDAFESLATPIHLNQLQFLFQI